MVGGRSSAMGLEPKAVLYLVNTRAGSLPTLVMVTPSIPRFASTDLGRLTMRVIRLLSVSFQEMLTSVPKLDRSSLLKSSTARIFWLSMDSMMDPFDNPIELAIELSPIPITLTPYCGSPIIGKGVRVD